MAIARGSGDAGALEARLIPIDDPDDPRVAEFRDIRERDLRRRSGSFIAEGTVVLRVLAQSQGRPFAMKARKVLVLDNRLGGVRDILAGFSEDVPVMTASRAVIDRIAGFPMHRGVLAIGERAAPASLEAVVAALPPKALVLVASAISNHDNVGALFRNAAAFGVDAVLMDDLCCDPLYRKAIRVSVGAVLRVPFVQEGSVEAILWSLAGADVSAWGLSPSGEALVENIPLTERTALVVGTEGEGLPAGLMTAMRTARIAQAPGFDSLNLATAAGIALHSVAGRTGRI
jgi:tRNA G18 (ribose-2'-O)-methylase SpoU